MSPRSTCTLAFFLLTIFLAGCATSTGPSTLSLDEIRANKTERRTLGARAEDIAISLKIYNRIKERFGTDTIEVNSIVFNRTVILVGSVSSREDAKIINNLVAQVENVRSVINELSVGMPRSAAEKFDDERLESQTLNTIESIAKINKSLIKVASYRQHVFLVGIVFEDEASLAANSASRVPGVKRIVRAFELVGPRSAASAANPRSDSSRNALNFQPTPPPSTSAPPQTAPTTTQTVKETNQVKSLPLKETGVNDSEKRINDAKSKCADVGFKPQTEKFGECVLKLSK